MDESASELASDGQRPTRSSDDALRMVVAGALIGDGYLLAAKRSTPPALAGQWELPGGKVEPGEDPRDALRRELQEELCIVVEIGELVGGPVKGDWPLSDSSVLRVFIVDVSGQAVSPEAGDSHSEIRWLDADSVSTVRWLPADRAPVEQLRSRLRSPH